MANQFIFKDTTLNVGDRVQVHTKIEEEGKTRTQVFEGLIIAIKGREENKTFTVRKIGANNIGVERIFPVMTPIIEKIDVRSKGKVRRAKLFYLRERVGRRALRVKEA
jgi:large subunit ribosomal protein L19